MKESERSYTGPLQYFHNFEHDPEGRTHCVGPESNSYVIIHENGKHVINTEYARGHGKGNEPQWFRFTNKVGNGYDLASGVLVDVSRIPESGKKPQTNDEKFSEAFKEAMAKKQRLGH